MSMPLRSLALAACAAVSLASPAGAQATRPADAPAFPRVTLANTEVRSLRSRATGQPYELWVSLPDGYATNARKRYPIVYVLDGQWDLKLLASVYGGLVYDKYVPEMIVVGITYPGESPDYNALRAVDYTPVPAATTPGAGGGPRFLSFLKTEVVPFMESNYRADPSQRVLLGSSLGGLFTLYSMFSEPSFFHGYIAASPAVTFGDSASFREEAEYAAKHGDLPVRLFIGVGSEEELTGPVKAFIRTLRGRSYPSLKLDARVIEDERHAGNKPEVYNRGLRFVFQQE